MQKRPHANIPTLHPPLRPEHIICQAITLNLSYFCNKEFAALLDEVSGAQVYEPVAFHCSSWTIFSNLKDASVQQNQNVSSCFFSGNWINEEITPRGFVAPKKDKSNFLPPSWDGNLRCPESKNLWVKATFLGDDCVRRILNLDDTELFLLSLHVHRCTCGTLSRQSAVHLPTILWAFVPSSPCSLVLRSAFNRKETRGFSRSWIDICDQCQNFSLKAKTRESSAGVLKPRIVHGC